MSFYSGNTTVLSAASPKWLELAIPEEGLRGELAAAVAKLDACPATELEAWYKRCVEQASGQIPENIIFSRLSPAAVEQICQFFELPRLERDKNGSVQSNRNRACMIWGISLGVLSRAFPRATTQHFSNNLVKLAYTGIQWKEAVLAIHIQHMSRLNAPWGSKSMDAMPEDILRAADMVEWDEENTWSSKRRQSLIKRKAGRISTSSDASLQPILSEESKSSEPGQGDMDVDGREAVDINNAPRGQGPSLHPQGAELDAENLLQVHLWVNPQQHGHSIAKFDGKAWLDDTCIEGCLKSVVLLQPNCNFAPPWLGLVRGSEQVKAFHARQDTKGNGWRQLNLYMVPMHVNGSHWVLCVVRRIDGRTKVDYYDPKVASGTDVPQDRRALLSKMLGATPEDDMDAWSFSKPAHPIQRDGYNCGVYILVYALYIALALPLPDTIDADVWRRIWKALLVGNFPQSFLPEFHMVHFQKNDTLRANGAALAAAGMSVDVSVTDIRKCISYLQKHLNEHHGSHRHRINMAKDMASALRQLYASGASIRATDAVTWVRQEEEAFSAMEQQLSQLRSISPKAAVALEQDMQQGNISRQAAQVYREAVEGMSVDDQESHLALVALLKSELQEAHAQDPMGRRTDQLKKASILQTLLGRLQQVITSVDEGVFRFSSSSEGPPLVKSEQSTDSATAMSSLPQWQADIASKEELSR